MKIRSGDQVAVLKGKDKGKRGKVEKVFPKRSMVLVSGVNIYKKHKKPAGKTLQGGVIDISKPLPAGSIALVCPKCSLPTKVSYKVGEKVKERICKKCNQIIG